MDIAAGKIFKTGDSVGRFIIGNGDEGREGTGGRCLSVYNIETTGARAEMAGVEISGAESEGKIYKGSNFT